MEIAISLLDAAENHPEQDNLPEIITKNGTEQSGNLRGAVSQLTALVNDGTPEVVRECISNATLLFQTTLDGEIETRQNDGQSLMENFTAAVYELVHRQGISDGVKFVAVKFLEKIILHLADGQAEDAAEILGFMLELLTGKFAVIKTSVILVIINSLVGIAKRRPEFCGRVLQVLVDLNPDVKSARGHMGSLVYAFKSAFLALLRCPHWGALPWRDRLLGVLRGMNFGDAAEQAVRRADRALRDKKRHTGEKATGEMTWKKQATGEMMTWKETAKKAEVEKLADVAEEGLVPALQKLTVRQPDVEQEQEQREKGSINGLPAHVDKTAAGPVHVDQIVAMMGALLEQGEKGCEAIEILIRKMDPDLLADVVIANMSNLPRRSADMSIACQIGTSGVVSRVVSFT